MASNKKYIIVGRNNTEHISEKNLECDSLECQNAIKIKGIWNGILIKACSWDIPSVILGVSEIKR